MSNLIFSRLVNITNPKVVVDDDAETVAINNFGLKYKHDQDCCEKVYADIDMFRVYRHQIEALYKVERIRITAEIDMGFTVFFEDTLDEEGEYLIILGVFIPCYNVQNGYYSSDLCLTVTVDNDSTTYNISNYVKDYID